MQREDMTPRCDAAAGFDSLLHDAAERFDSPLHDFNSNNSTNLKANLTKI
jgi:hypothetical protein